MDQDTFVRQREGQWRALETWLQRPAGGRRGHDRPSPEGDFPHLYRRACQHLAMARARGYSPRLVERLERLALDGHARLYRAPGALWVRIAAFFAAGLPRSVRAEAAVVAVAAALLFVPMLTFTLAVPLVPELAHTVLPAQQVADLEEMYGGKTVVDTRAPEAFADQRSLMFGFYIYNNAGIGFRTFAGGLVFGLGSVLILLLNGLVIGAAAGHLTHLGYGPAFWGFVAGHSAFELTAIVLSGAAGLRLGLALLAPGRRRRGDALRRAARHAIPLVLGAATLFVLAAGVEAFWSPLDAPPARVKYAVGIALWLVLWAYLLLAGRSRAD
jgi:uncharacterized membrane protein SpoIIM required for sporulation